MRKIQEKFTNIRQTSENSQNIYFTFRFSRNKSPLVI